MVYRVGTCQCVVTKSAQSCLTNDPELWCWPITQYRHSHDGGLRGL